MRFQYVLAPACALIVALSSPTLAQGSADPGDGFLDIYQRYQKAEKLEASNPAAALKAFKDLAAQIDGFKSRFPNWSPTIVDYRLKRVEEQIVRLQQKGVTAAPGGESVPPLDPTAGILPDLPQGGKGGPLPPDLDAPLAPAPAAPVSKGRSKGGTAGSSGDPLEEMRLQREKKDEELRNARVELADAKRAQNELKTKLDQVQKHAEDADKNIKVLTNRADIAERALVEAKSKGTQESEAARVAEAALQKAKRELSEAKIDREAAEEVRQQIALRQINWLNQAGKFKKERDEAVKASASSKEVADKAEKLAEARVKEIEDRTKAALSAAEKRVQAVEKERDSLSEKLVAVTKERDDARTQVTKLQGAQKELDKLTADNQRLTQKLADAEKQIADYKAEGAQKDALIASLRTEIGTVKKQLADAQKQSATYQTQMAELQTKLDGIAKDLATSKTEGKAAQAEKKKMQEENDLLRTIAMRQMKDQARVDLARKALLEHMTKIDIKSEVVKKDLQDLAAKKFSPLSPKERALFKNAKVELAGDNEISMIAPTAAPAEATPAKLPAAEAKPEVVPVSLPKDDVVASLPPLPSKIAENTPPAPSPAPAAVSEVPPQLPPPVEKPAAAPAPAPEPPAPEKKETAAAAPAPVPAPAAESAPLPPEETATVASASRDLSKVPPAVMAFIQEGKEQYERGNFRDAEKSYEKALSQDPTNLYILSNLGVVRFRENKLKLAEEAFKKAIAIAPEDSFSHCKLGAVYYSQGKYDEAVNELTRALAIDSKDAVAHNYLGITASQKGWPEAAQKELETAVALDPANADAHFNLAVVYATQNPPEKDKARTHYKKATELGADPDTSLESMIK